MLVSLVINILYLFTSTKTLQNICKYWILLNNRVLSFLCNINYEVSGYEHLPTGPCILIANHQGPWESLFVQTLKIPSSSIIKKNLTVRQTENLVKSTKSKKISKKKSKDTNILDLQDKISLKTGMSVNINNSKSNTGIISFKYKSLDQLERLVKIIKSNF